MKQAIVYNTSITMLLTLGFFILAMNSCMTITT